MQFHAAVSTETPTHRAVQALAAEAARRLEAPPDLAVVFFSAHHRRATPELVAVLRDVLAPRTLLGCTGEGVIGASVEAEGVPAIALWVARLPGVHLTPFRLRFEPGTQGDRMLGWPRQAPQASERPFFILLADPFSTPINELLAFVQQEYPAAPIVGGMASGARMPGENRLLLDDAIQADGVVGVAVHGAIRLETVVSQGCRPIGERFLVTRAEHNVIHELGSRPALQCLAEVFAQLPEEEKALAQQGLHVGYTIDEQKDRFGRGDFLVRNLIGIDEENGSLAIGDWIREGQTVQFHIRDAEGAREDLRLLLEARKRVLGNDAALAALLFSCNGRGRRFFGTPHHDIRTLREHLGAIPVAGFFAQGEIGPIGPRNFLHGFTASIALFCRGNP